MPFALSGAAVRPCGAPGTVLGVALRLFEAPPAPAAFVALTVNEYAVPLVRPVIPLPPSDAGADQARVTCVLPGVAVFSVGARGTVRGVAVSAFDAAPGPA